MTSEKNVLQMGLVPEDVAFHSNIPVPLDITVAVVYSVFGELNLVYNTISEFSLSSARAEINSSMKHGILPRSLASSILFLTVLLLSISLPSTIYTDPYCEHFYLHLLCIFFINVCVYFFL